jgi:hypothetical protein
VSKATSQKRRAKELILTLEEAIKDADIEAAVAALRDALTARESIRVPVNGGVGRERFGYQMVADHSIRLQAARLLIEHKHGKATQQVRVQHEGGSGALPESPQQMLASIARDWADLRQIAEGYVDALEHVERVAPAKAPQLAAMEPLPEL